MNDPTSPPTQSKGIPSPAHPHKRREPLPWEQPKTIEEDPLSHQRVKAILESPSYREADEDVDFLNRDAARGARLQLDYLKPETLLTQHGVQHTIVTFGSTRIAEPAAALRKLAALRDAVARSPDDPLLQARLTVAERLQEKSRYYEVAREFGRLVGASGEGPADSRVVLMTGGGPGLMEAANRGAFDAGAKTVGLNVTLPHQQYPNPYVSPELCFRVHYFAIRKLHFLLRAKALVAFPGGYGTFDELFETLTLVQTRKIQPIPVVLVGEAFWSKAFDLQFLVDEGVIDPEDAELFWTVETAEEAWQSILMWHRNNGSPLF
jgi:uncharacterized protein (TIGR00730 family)